MSIVIIGTFGAMMIGAAIFALYSQNILSAIISSGVISLLASIIYILLAAPDVAMTESAIGSGLTTVVFLLALRRIQVNQAEKGGAAKAGKSASGLGYGLDSGDGSAEEAIDD